MKKLTLLAVAAVLLSAASCKKDNDNVGGNGPALGGEGFTAVADVQSGDSKTGLNGLNVVWSENDQIKVFDGEGNPCAFKLTEGATTPSGRFEKQGGGTFVMASNSFHAFYPNSDATTRTDADNYKIALSGVQDYVPGSFGNEANPMATYSTSTSLQFHNLCGVLKLTLQSATGKRVEMIEVQSNSQERLWGDACTVSFGGGGNPVLGMPAYAAPGEGLQGCDAVVLDCGASGVQLTAGGVDFYVVLPAVTFSQGLTVRVHDTEGGVIEKAAPSHSEVDNSIEAGFMRAMPAFALVDYPDIPDEAFAGGVKKEFTVNQNGEKVMFSKGNLRYNPASGKWSFAEHQYDMLHTENAEDVSDEYREGYDGEIDMFGWATSGYDGENGNATWEHRQPWSTCEENHYQNGGHIDHPMYVNNEYGYGLDAASGSWAVGSEYDWGMNRISNGGDEPNLWRTLTSGEWTYLLTGRATASGHRYAEVKVNGVNGLLVFPDDFPSEWPENAGSVPTIFNGSASDWNGDGYTVDEFLVLGQNGCVFLPCAGSRFGTMVGNVGSHGRYWSSTATNATRAYNLYFSGDEVNPANNNTRCSGRSVRLVCFRR